MLEITGIAFLWHMVRCIVSILFLIGDGEDPEIMKNVLDIDKYPGKPNYIMAPELPLVLHSCGYENLKISMQPKSLWYLTAHYEKIWQEHMISSSRALNSLLYLNTCTVRSKDVSEFFPSIIKRNTNFNNNNNGKKLNVTTDIIDELLRLNQDIDNTNSNNSNSNNNDEIMTSKRSRIDSNNITNDIAYNKDEIPWDKILKLMDKEFNLTPQEYSVIPYIPLMKRQTNITYDERVEQLGGIKRGRLERHLELQDTALEKDPKFFSNMRKQGSTK
jgi:hypothetical protein